MSGAGSPNWARYKQKSKRLQHAREARRAEVDREIWEARRRKQRLVDRVREAHRRMMGEGA